jgi:hydrogenase expression/formation protein HypE
MRDPTRGGVATTLNEWAKSAKVGIKLEEQNLPVNAGTRGACEILGIDPLYVANEGKLLAVVETADVEKILAAMQKNALGREARQIGFITDQHKGMVTLKNIYGVERVIDLPVGEQLPRIC